MLASTILFGAFVFISFFVTLGISFIIVDHIDVKPQGVLAKLWRTGYMGHTIFISTFFILLGIAKLFKNYL